MEFGWCVSLPNELTGHPVTKWNITRLLLIDLLWLLLDYKNIIQFNMLVFYRTAAVTFSDDGFGLLCHLRENKRIISPSPSPLFVLISSPVCLSRLSALLSVWVSLFTLIEVLPPAFWTMISPFSRLTTFPVNMTSSFHHFASTWSFARKCRFVCKYFFHRSKNMDP